MIMKISKITFLVLAVLFADGCTKPFTPLPTAVQECGSQTGNLGDAFHRCMHDKGWVYAGKGWEQVP